MILVSFPTFFTIDYSDIQSLIRYRQRSNSRLNTIFMERWVVVIRVILSYLPTTREDIL